MNIKARILLGVFLLELIGYGILLFYSNQAAKATLLRVRNEQIQAIIASNFYRINNLTQLLEHKALDLAHAGEVLYALKGANSAATTETAFSRFLVDSMADSPEAIGGGIWYEPYRFDPSKIYFGPYAFLNAKNAVEFTWDLNTEQYDYHHQSWYQTGLPADWPREIPRPQSIYWTDPYYDEAGSKALMMTVDAMMYSSDKKIIGLATVDWSLLEMTNFIQNINVTKNSKVFLIDTRSDFILSNTLQPESVMKKRPSIPWLEHIDVNVEGSDVARVVSVTINEVFYQVFYSKTQMGLIFGVVIPQAEIYQEIEMVAKNQIEKGLVIIIFFILAMLVLLYVLFKPFQKVQKLIKSSILMSADNKLSIKPVTYSDDNEFTPIIGAINVAYEQINIYTEKVEEANKSKTNFLSTMSHEIRTPMNAILGYAQLLSLESEFPSEHKITLQAIDSSGKHLLSLLNDILDIAKIESGERIMHPQNTYLADLLLSVERIFKLRCLQKGLRWHGEFSVPNEQIVFADGAKISQILINLLGNALKFTSVGEIKFLCALSEGILSIEISDTGMGIRAEFKERIFTAFAQDTAGRQQGGTGLGLAIVARLVHLMAGDISFTSVENAGTSFKVRVPLAPENTQYPPAKRDVEPAAGNFAHREITALVVDDVKINCDILSKILQKLGVESYQAHNGLEALAILETHQPAILFVDIQMPVMDGFEFLEQLKIKHPHLVARTIAISANVYKSTQEYMDQGFGRYITKPFLIKDISAAIDAIVSI